MIDDRIIRLAYSRYVRDCNKGGLSHSSYKVWKRNVEAILTRQASLISGQAEKGCETERTAELAGRSGAA